jgi:hypothetical protein
MAEGLKVSMQAQHKRNHGNPHPAHEFLQVLPRWLRPLLPIEVFVEA